MDQNNDRKPEIGFDKPTRSVRTDGNSEPSRGTQESTKETRPNPQFARISTFDLGDAPGSSSDDRTGDAGSGPRRRGRPRGSKNRTETPAPASHLIFDLEALLLTNHLMLARFLDAEEIALDPVEAKQLADAIKNVAQFYPIGMDPKKLAWFQLCIAMGSVYGPRVVAIHKRRKQSSPKVTPINTPKHANPVNGVPAPPSEPVRKSWGEMSPSEINAEAPIDHGGSDY